MIQALIRETRKICSKLPSKQFAWINTPTDKEADHSSQTGVCSQSPRPCGRGQRSLPATPRGRGRARRRAQASWGGAARARGRLGSGAMLASSALYCHKKSRLCDVFTTRLDASATVSEEESEQASYKGPEESGVAERERTSTGLQSEGHSPVRGTQEAMKETSA